MVPEEDDVARFAALLRQLKDRTDRSYGALARRLHMNTSTLHRYCAGEAVPVDFAPVERFAALCGASAEERLELHRLWLAAVAARQRPAGKPETTQAAASAAGAAAAGATEAASAAASGAAPAPRATRWYRRRRLTATTAAVAAVLLATLGTLSALPDGSSSVEADGRLADPTPTTTSGAPKSPSPTSPSPSSSGSATPSPSVSGKAATSAPPTGGGGAASGNGPSGGGSSGGEETPTGTAAVPLTWTADSHEWALGCGHDYVIDKPPQQVPPPPAPQDAANWARALGAVHGREQLVEISVQGRSSTAVVLEALRVRVVGRGEPVAGKAYSMDQGCGGSLSPRYFAVDLDINRPIARPVDGGDENGPIPAVRMPYRVSSEDPEVLLVTATTKTCDCRWFLELDWSSQGRSGTVRIDDHGRPFRTSSIEGLSRYSYNQLQWTPWTD
ncbi:helix-turn-helix transcriptional regulator [Streptomyces sp. DG2A-72]|uniref:helix-turn-helix domain-containing protein n=1 Tax=Streptomyces sp. DG2A-72 TaxID=3051386 RepID=UPI00265C4364|nr:helix-turn-helix transcriptional regulator [Streptomyces sp. DG2A-72]MDO0937596.1 helix-turn-helix transcriptional regulator [Streptomyces sp. DG2A-72]